MVKSTWCGLCNSLNKELFVSELSYCSAVFDSYLCWPPTEAGEKVFMNCPRERLSDPTRKYLLGNFVSSVSYLNLVSHFIYVCYCVYIWHKRST